MLIALERIAAGTNIGKILIVMGDLVSLRFRLHVVELKCYRPRAPNFPPKAENTAKLKIISKPVAVGLPVSIAAWTMPPDMGLMGIPEGEEWVQRHAHHSSSRRSGMLKFNG